MTIRLIDNLVIDKYFMATIGIVPGYGLTEGSEHDCEIKRQILDRAREVILLADSSKFNTHGMFRSTPIERITRLISDNKISPAHLQFLHSNGLEPILVEL